MNHSRKEGLFSSKMGDKDKTMGVGRSTERTSVTLKGQQPTFGYMAIFRL